MFGDTSECANTGLFAPFLFVCRKTRKKMEDILAILQALTWASSRCKYSDVSTLGIKRLQEVFINFEDTPASNIEPLRYEMGGTEILSFVYTGYSQSCITITPALPFIVYMHDGKSLFGSESNCSKDVINFLCKNKQTRTISFNAPQNIVNKEQKPHVNIRNKMSAREFVLKQNSPLSFVENTNTHKLHFTCGNIKGYISPAAKEQIKHGQIDDFWYAEVSINGRPYVPCIMLGKKREQQPKETTDDLPF